MHVFFSALVTFTDNISVKFWNKLKKDSVPFASLSGSGGPKSAHIQGVMELDEAPDAMIRYRITEGLVLKVELLTNVGIEKIEFHELTRGVDATPIPSRLDEEALNKMSKAELSSLLINRFGYKSVSSKTPKSLLVESVLYSQRDEDSKALIRESLLRMNPADDKVT